MNKPKQEVSYFIADLHLTENRPDITACFLTFLKNDAVVAENLYILGDLFEAWIGDDDDNPFVHQVAVAINALNKSGTKVYFIHGNRDFLIGKRYAKKSGMQLLPEVDLIELYGKEIVIMHGDTLCTKDIAYQAFRKKSRSWWWQLIVTNLPLFIRKKIAADYRKKSAQATASKSEEIMDVTEQEVVNTLEHYKTQILIHGHTHRPFIHNLTANNKPAQRIVLGDWYDQGAWLKFDRSGYELLNMQFNS